MAEDINITGVDLDNSSMWATEKVQEQLLEKLSDLFDLTKEQKSDWEDGFKDMKETGKVTRENLKKTKSSGAGGGGNMFGDITDGLSEFAGEITDGGDAMSDFASGPLEKFGKTIKKVTKRMGLMGGAVGLIMQQAGMAIATIRETVNVLTDLNNIGITVEGGFQQFQQNLADSGMTLAELSNVTSTYARTVGNVGLKSLISMTKAAEQSGFAFTNYGLQLKEGVEFQAKMLESQRLGGIFEVRDKAAQSLALADNIKNLTAYSKILNVSRDELADAQVKAKTRADVQRKLNSIVDEDQRRAANASFDQFSAIAASLGEGGEEFMGLMIDVMAKPVAEASEAFTAIASVSPEAANAIKEFQRAMMAGEDITPEMVTGKLFTVLDAASKGQAFENLALGESTAQVATIMGGPLLNSLRNYQQRLEDATGDTVEEKLSNLAESTDESVSAAVRLQNEMDFLAATFKSARVDVFMKAFGDESKAGLEMMTSSIKGLREGVEWMSEASGSDILTKAVELFTEFVIMPMKNLAIGMWNSIKTKFSEMIDTLMLFLQDIPVKFTNAIASSGIGEALNMEVRALPSEVAAQRKQRVMTGASSSDLSTGRANAEAALSSARANNDQRMIEILEAQLVWLEKQSADLTVIRRGNSNGMIDQG